MATVQNRITDKNEPKQNYKFNTIDASFRDSRRA